MKIKIRALRTMIAEALDEGSGLSEKIAEIQDIAFETYAIHLPEESLRSALMNDAIKTGRLPSAAECRAMIEGNEEDEDVTFPTLERDFPETLSELEAAWQLA